MLENKGGLEGKKSKSENVSSNRSTRERRVLDPRRSSGILSRERMGALEGKIPAPEVAQISRAEKLHQQLESAGAYDQLKQFDPRRATMLQKYLTTENSAEDIGKEVGLGSRSRATELLHSAMELAFFTLPEDQRAEYDNNPSIALQTRSRQQTQQKSERLKEAHNQRPKNEATGKILFSDTHKRHLSEGNIKRWKRARRVAQTEDQLSNRIRRPPRR